jgi:hypothetical protein
MARGARHIAPGQEWAQGRQAARKAGYRLVVGLYQRAVQVEEDGPQRPAAQGCQPWNRGRLAG